MCYGSPDIPDSLHFLIQNPLHLLPCYRRIQKGSPVAGIYLSCNNRVKRRDHVALVVEEKAGVKFGFCFLRPAEKERESETSSKNSFSGMGMQEKPSKNGKFRIFVFVVLSFFLVKNVRTQMTSQKI